MSRLASLEIKGENDMGKTVVRGLRASQSFFDRCDLIAKEKGIDRNKLIIMVVNEYCEKVLQKVGFIENISMSKALDIEIEQLLKSNKEN
jgi:hypothetical protein